MDQLVSFEVGEKYLVALGHGKIDSFASILILIETMDQYLSYKKIQINVNLTEAFNIVKRYGQPALKNIIIAAVFDGRGWAFAKYWKEIGEKRGFSITIFVHLDSAER